MASSLSNPSPVSRFLFGLRKFFGLSSGQDFSEEYQETVQKILSERFSQVSGISDLKARSKGERKFLEFRLEFKKETPSSEHSNILGSILDDLKEEFPYTEIIIYPEVK
ncbi:cation transporter dimerization domain-containing protein [Leptospira sarikeiensis]|uniref:Cation efflux protein cytoplasmic domain-containing protein n=1 Tax=Leptospira sarikeiensis TaxID=2484943 RepID=A0A4R9K6H7_9LEPT|nr:cation transporter dimerization domain-containing protein [Leptospira sarikeiensis]TGL60851.1 hypothetical protein EHQ64_13655 [Leptospira sarikeiensis]